jgi:hypothetical protein
LPKIGVVRVDHQHARLVYLSTGETITSPMSISEACSLSKAANVLVELIATAALQRPDISEG